MLDAESLLMDSWMGLPANVISLLRQVMRYWKTRLEIWNGGGGESK